VVYIPTVYVGARIDSELAKKLDDLVSGGKGKNRSAVIWEALNDYVSAYTANPPSGDLRQGLRPCNYD
jgi:metal-responsive CopG/Arc/MetJ family transcriptional regulator